MILIDERIGSKELLPLFRPYDVPVSTTHLDFGDLAWSGYGPDGSTTIGVERKRIHDLCSSMRSKRLSGYQLPGLLESYSYVYLLVEGIIRCGPRGEADLYIKDDWRPLIVGSSTILYREIDHYLSTLTHICGVTVHYTANPRQTVAFVVSRYKWWNDKLWSKHDSHMAIYAPYNPPNRGRIFKRHVGLVEKMASQLPSVDKKAFDIGKRFKTVRQMVMADVSEWSKIKGIGDKSAQKIVDSINGKVYR